MMTLRDGDDAVAGPLDKALCQLRRADERAMPSLGSVALVTASVTWAAMCDRQTDLIWRVPHTIGSPEVIRRGCVQQPRGRENRVRRRLCGVSREYRGHGLPRSQHDALIGRSRDEGRRRHRDSSGALRVEALGGQHGLEKWTHAGTRRRAHVEGSEWVCISSVRPCSRQDVERCMSHIKTHVGAEMWNCTLVILRACGGRLSAAYMR